MILALVVALLDTSQPDPLATGFLNPPASARPHTWWHWMDGNVTKEGITADLEAMREVGIGGAQMFTVAQGIPKGPVDYMSSLWREMTTHAIKEAGRLGIELCIHNCAGWSSSGGPWVEPENAMQTLAWSSVAVRGPGRVQQELPPIKAPQVFANVNYRRDIVVFAYPSPPQGTFPAGSGVPSGQFRDVTANVKDGVLTWDAPDGEWIVLRIGHVPTGKDNHPAPEEGRGLEVDKMSRAALDDFWQGTMATVIRDAGPLAGKVLNNALVDSYEVGDQNWTPLMREEFIQRRGYDPLPWLPVVAGVTIESKEKSDRFMWDWRRTIADLFADNYFGYFGELCRKNGLLFSTEPYGGPFDGIQSGGTADIPMGEFWIGGGPNTLDTTKIASSVGHVYGRKIIGAEAFTADSVRGRWLEEPYSAKTLGDLVFTNGVNRYIFHRYAHQPWMDKFPGMTMGPWGTHLERTQTWWTEAREWMKYVARCQYMLQQGTFVADVLYFTGEGAPNNLPYRPNLRPRIPNGYDYDGCDTFTLMRLSVGTDGWLALPSGMSYRVLVLPETDRITPAVARKIRDLVEAGAIVVGPKPVASPSLVGYPEADEEVRRIAGEAWDGGVHATSSLEVVFERIGVEPDFSYSSFSGGSKLAYIHRRIGDDDVYFVSNQQYRPTEAAVRFRVSGRQPEIWHPDTGVIEPAAIFADSGGDTTVTIHLDPAESVFVVFRKDARTEGVTRFVTSYHTVASQAPKIDIEIARYEALDGRGADVTETVRQMVKEGTYEIPASNAVFGDPVVNVVKRLRIDYTRDGVPMTQIVPENETIYLIEIPMSTNEIAPYRVQRRGDKTFLAAFKPFSYDYWTSGLSRRGTASAPLETTITGQWQVSFAKDWGAPPRAAFPELSSWSDNSDDGIKYFSGSAVYTKQFDVPPSMLSGDRLVVLDLGRVKNFATVTLNGKDLGVLWKEPFTLDVTKAVKAGRNELKVKVTNLWVNRIIGDEQLPPDVEWNGAQLKQWPDWLLNNGPRPDTGRYTFTTWRFWNKDSKLLESGLLGPVTLRSARWIELGP
ncbi:MAG: glycosyl hydrolase [Fimbriimonadaceae bacterium]